LDLDFLLHMILDLQLLRLHELLVFLYNHSFQLQNTSALGTCYLAPNSINRNLNR
jgi:hypothetical protein